MNKISIFALFAAVQIFLVPAVQADPRMETNDDFCHFILDPVYTDNEVFLADCGSTITVTEIVEPDIIAIRGPSETSKCLENYMAQGYAQATSIIPASAAPLAPGTTLVLTSKDSEYPCYMVESNGRQYQSYSWTSRITVSEQDDSGLVKVGYVLFCQ